VNYDELYALIMRFEGLRLRPYLCPAGVWTCGWGSTGPDVVPGVPWTRAYADRRMRRDAQKFVDGTLRLVPHLEGPALCAIADFSYNLGLGRLQSSTLRKRLLAHDYEGACVELRRWVRGGGKILPGLVIRREAECRLLSLHR
jgi:lysozyme